MPLLLTGLLGRELFDGLFKGAFVRGGIGFQAANLKLVVFLQRQLIRERADSRKERMGLTTWKNAPRGKILKPEVSVAKNYLTEKEIKALDRIVTMYLDYAESQAERGIPMTMQDWANKLNAFLQFNERDILDHPGKVTAEVARAFAQSEFEKYRVVQDRLFESDFDRAIKQLPKEGGKP